MGQSSYRLVVRADSPAARTLSVPPEGTLRVGSGRGCQVHVDGPDVREAHCFLRSAGGRLAVLVQDETAQVLVNGKPERKKILAAGDLLEIGVVKIRVESVERDPLLGATLGGYRLESRLGRGASGTVYLATQLSLDRRVALKILAPEMTRDAAFVAKFLEEAKAAAKLNHPNVVQVYDAGTVPAKDGDGTSSGPLYLFSMEYLAGGTLQQVLDKEGKIPIERALAVGCDAARALAWAEEQGIVHRDIKPANLLFAADGAVKVADMGIATDVDRVMEGAETLSGAGSPRYMAPEQALRRGVDHRADIYALACTLVRAIAGRHVFEEKSTAEVLKAKTTRDAPAAASLLPGAPASLARLLDRMLAREMTQRPKTCAEVLQGLEKALAELHGKAPAASRQAAAHRSPAAEEGEEDLQEAEAAAESAWTGFFGSTAGKVNLSVSALLIFSAVLYAMTVKSDKPPLTPAVTAVADGGLGPDDPLEPPPDPILEEPETKETKTTAPPAAANHNAGDVKAAAEHSRIITEYRAGLTDGPRAVAALEDFKRKFPSWADRADTNLAQIRATLEEAGRATLAKLMEKEIDPRLQGGEYQEAMVRLLQAAERLPYNKKEVGEATAKIEEAAQAAAKAAEDEAAKAAATADFAKAIAAWRRIEKKLPAPLQERAASAATQLEKDRDSFAAIAVKLEAQATGVWEAIARLDFAAAATAASAIPSSSNPILEKRRTHLGEQVEGSRKAWTALQGASQRAGQTAAPELLRKPVKDLSALFGDSSAAGAEALGFLLLPVQGPAVASPLLLDARLAAGRLEANRALLEAAEKPFLTRRAKTLKDRAAKLQAEPATPQRGQAWEALAVEAAETIAANHGLGGYGAVKDDLAHAFVRARIEVARGKLPGNLFHGKVRSYKPDGAIEIAYELLDPQELLDFVPVQSAASRVEIEERMVKMRGELRFGRGDVFRGRAGVTLKLPANGYSPLAPNVNVALWTREDDAVTLYQLRPGELAPPAKGKKKAAPEGNVGDFIALGVGYKVKLPDNRPGLAVLKTGPQIAMPLHALLGGIRGKPLHALDDEDCYFAEAAAGKVKGTLTVRAAMTGDALTWTINGRQLPLRNAKGLETLKRAEPRVGSVTLFSNGEVLFYTSIVIEGDLNPAWVEEKLRAEAEEELRKIAKK